MMPWDKLCPLSTLAELRHAAVHHAATAGGVLRAMMAAPSATMAGTGAFPYNP